MQRLTVAQVQAFYAAKLAAGTGTRVVQLCHLRLSQALEWAVRMGLVTRNVCDVVERPTDRRREMHVWTPDDAQRFLEATDGTNWQTLFLLILSTGLRRGEALGLRWRDLDLDAGMLTVRQTVVALHGKPYVQTPKTNAGRRVVKMPAEAVAALRTYRAQQNERRLSLGALWQDHDLVFPNETGGVLFPGNVGRAFRALVKRAGLPPTRIHDLRHAHASWLLLSGLPIKVVSDRLGHARASTTLDIYAHLMPGAQDAAVETTSDLLFRKGA